CSPQRIFTAECVAWILGLYIGESLSTIKPLEYVPADLPTYRLETEQGVWRLELGRMVLDAFEEPQFVGCLVNLPNIFSSLPRACARGLAFPFSLWFVWEGIPETLPETPILQWPDFAAAENLELGRPIAVVQFRKQEAYLAVVADTDMPTDSDYVLLPTSGELPEYDDAPEQNKGDRAGYWGAVGRFPSFKSNAAMGLAGDDKTISLELPDIGLAKEADSSPEAWQKPDSVAQSEALSKEQIKEAYETEEELKLSDADHALVRVYEPTKWDETLELAKDEAEEPENETEPQGSSFDAAIALEMAKHLRSAHLRRYISQSVAWSEVDTEQLIMAWLCTNCHSYTAVTVQTGGSVPGRAQLWRRDFLRGVQEYGYTCCRSCGDILSTDALVAVLGACFTLSDSIDLHWYRWRDAKGGWRESWGHIEYDGLNIQRVSKESWHQELLTDRAIADRCGEYSSLNVHISHLLSDLFEGVPAETEGGLRGGVRALQTQASDFNSYASLVFGEHPRLKVDRSTESGRKGGSLLTVQPPLAYLPDGWPKAGVLLKLDGLAERIGKCLDEWGKIADGCAAEWFTQRGSRGDNGTCLVWYGPDVWARLDVERFSWLALQRELNPDELACWAAYCLRQQGLRNHRILQALSAQTEDWDCTIDAGLGIAKASYVDSEGHAKKVRFNMNSWSGSDTPQERAVWLLREPNLALGRCACGQPFFVSLKIATREYWEAFDSSLITNSYCKPVISGSDKLWAAYVLRCPHHVTEVTCRQWHAQHRAVADLMPLAVSNAERVFGKFKVFQSRDDCGKKLVFIGGAEAGGLVADAPRLAGVMEAAALPLPENFMVWGLMENLLVISENLSDKQYWRHAEEEYWKRCLDEEPAAKRWDFVQRGKIAAPCGRVQIVWI
ncbi:hypothetical protein IJT17_03115, partial [bacterium]|nr:hypothetical protein [bacterium]